MLSWRAGSELELIFSSARFITILYKCTGVFITYFPEKAKLEDNVPAESTIFLLTKTPSDAPTYQ